MKTKYDNLFWISYSDLMTSLFFIMLVLYALTFFLLKKQQTGLRIENERLNKILRMEEQFTPLQNDSDFIYLPNCQKFIVKDLMGVEIFDPTETVIKNEYIDRTIEAGKKIEEFLINLNKTNKEFSYLLVIEGNMANKWDYSINKDNTWGYATSYKRALTVYNLWLNNNIDFREYNVEVIICGSGFNGLCRDNIEENNKRFSIQIIPKVTNR